MAMARKKAVGWATKDIALPFDGGVLADAYAEFEAKGMSVLEIVAGTKTVLDPFRKSMRLYMGDGRLLWGAALKVGKVPRGHVRLRARADES